MKRPRKIRNHGVTIVELLIVISACSVILTLSAGLVHRVMHTHSKARAFFEVERSCMRLSERFRRHVHEARNVRIEDAAIGEGVLLRLDLADGQAAEYLRTPSGVKCILSQNENIVSQEEFSFQAAVDVEAREEHSPPCVVLSIKAAPPEISQGGHALSATGIPVRFEAVAAMGLDLQRQVPASQEPSP